jgi:DeoR/GlpR family transcriptional regulator of sugar metabolism
VDVHELADRELRARGRITVPEIADLTGCSEMTVRRDLDVLAHDGLLRRVRGAAVSALTDRARRAPSSDRTGMSLTRSAQVRPH